MTIDRRAMLRGAVGASAAFVATQAESTKGEIRQAQYVIVELLGYKKLCGRLSQGFGGLLQLDVPAEGGFITQFINPASVYRITVVDAETVAEFAKSIDPLPAITLEYPMRQTNLAYDDDDDFRGGSAF
jgi:hypothetical protein